jgi:hypothetical protein
VKRTALALRAAKGGLKSLPEVVSSPFPRRPEPAKKRRHRVALLHLSPSAGALGKELTRGIREGKYMQFACLPRTIECESANPSWVVVFDRTLISSD